ncbi:MAG: tetraacyldisaccharide 4'-kinase [Cytophagaceae bacterium]|jgi:tetraacyldisaccharide 4'-kinase|nr:tetraacyldisaccharide 4'-kinase [Cytophagaceae bacterium]
MRLLLLPFSLIYAAVTAVRNFLFDKGILESKSYGAPIISVGNLTVGGTGKTPLTEYIFRLLMPNYRCALLSRGYGRRTRGVIVASNGDTYRTIGDEPAQLHRKFPELTVAVAEKRRAGIETLLQLPQPPEVIVMDDAYQHRYVKADFSILVMDYYRPVWKDFCLPAGNLRELQNGVNRCNTVVINKCPPDLSPAQAQTIRQKLKLRSGQSLFFTSIVYGEPLAAGVEKSFADALKNAENRIAAVAGIGNPTPFFDTVRQRYGNRVKTLAYRDHYPFKGDDIKKIVEQTFDNNKIPVILTTEKDAMRICEIPDLPHELLNAVWYIPIELMTLFDDKDLFEHKIKNYVAEN